MTPGALLVELTNRGVRFAVHADRLQVEAAEGVLQPDDLAALRELKPEILRYLRAWLYVPPPDPVTVREVLGPEPTAAELEAFHHELANALWDLRDRWAGREHRAGTIVVRGRPLVDWLRLDDVAAIIRSHSGGVR